MYRGLKGTFKRKVQLGNKAAAGQAHLRAVLENSWSPVVPRLGSTFSHVWFVLLGTGRVSVVQAGTALTSIAQTSLELTEILLPQSLKRWGGTGSPSV